MSRCNAQFLRYLFYIICHDNIAYKLSLTHKLHTCKQSHIWIWPNQLNQQWYKACQIYEYCNSLQITLGHPDRSGVETAAFIRQHCPDELAAGYKWVKYDLNSLLGVCRIDFWGLVRNLKNSELVRCSFFMNSAIQFRISSESELGGGIRSIQCW